MLGLWIALGVLAALILLIWRLRLGVLASFGGGQVTVDLRIGPFRIRLTPRQKREKPPQKRRWWRIHPCLTEGSWLT